MHSVFSFCRGAFFGFILIAVLAAMSPGRAQLPVQMGEEVVVTATRIPQRIADSSQHVTVISAEDIAASGQQTLVELLQMRGGVEITNSGGFGQPSAVLIRGSEPRHTLVLVDGLRLSSATVGATAFENIPLNQIERIEIVPGPLSSVYGSDAIGGVVQIFTKRGGGASAKLGVGSYRTGEVNAAVGRRIGATEFSISVGVLDSNGFDNTKPTIPFGQHNPDADGYRNTNFSGRLAHHFGDAHEIGLAAFQSKGRTQFDAGLATDDVNRQTLNAFSAYSRNRLASRWTSLVRLGTTRDKSVTVGAFPGVFQTDQNQATWQNDFHFESGTLVAGLEYLEQRVDSDTPFKETSRTVVSGYGGYYGAFGNHGFQASVRHDDSSDFGTRNTGSLGYSYRFSPTLRVRAAAGTAFKAPTFNDLYFPDFPPFFFSNPNLRPERSRSREIGADINVSVHTVAITAFENNISDLITIFTDPATFVSTTANLSQARIRGVEFVYRGQIAGWQTRAQATLQDPRDETTDFQLRRRAKQYGSVLVKRDIGRWDFGVEVTGASVRFDSTTEAPNTRMHGYGLLNLTARYAVTREWSVNARWNNVFDRQYELVQFFNTPGSNVFAWLAYQPR